PLCPRLSGGPADLSSDGCRMLEVLMRGTVVAARQRGALACPALAGGRVTAGDTPIQEPGVDLLFDEGCCGTDAFAHRPRDLGLCGDGEVAANVREERSVRTGEVMRVFGEPRHR